MNCYWVVLSVALPSKRKATDFKVLMYEENRISRFKLRIYQDRRGKWRVVRKIFEWELGDPLFGNREKVAQYRKHLRNETRKTKRLIKGRLK